MMTLLSWLCSVADSAGDGDSHRTCRSGHLPLGRFDVGGVEVGQLDGCDLLDLGTGDRADLLAARGGCTLLEAGGLAQECRGRRGLEAVSYTHLTLPTKRIV